jgi:ABC-type uncharacterized transport system YnjBCD ATPase subunit
MPDEMIANPAQNSGGVRAAAVFLSAHVLQPRALQNHEMIASARCDNACRENCFMFKIILCAGFSLMICVNRKTT